MTDYIGTFFKEWEDYNRMDLSRQIHPDHKEVSLNAQKHDSSNILEKIHMI